VAGGSAVPTLGLDDHSSLPMDNPEAHGQRLAPATQRFKDRAARIGGFTFFTGTKLDSMVFKRDRSTSQALITTRSIHFSLPGHA
jgi:hypothetical protein